MTWVLGLQVWIDIYLSNGNTRQYPVIVGINHRSACSGVGGLYPPFSLSFEVVKTVPLADILFCAFRINKVKKFCSGHIGIVYRREVSSYAECIYTGQTSADVGGSQAGIRFGTIQVEFRYAIDINL